MKKYMSKGRKIIKMPLSNVSAFAHNAISATMKSQDNLNGYPHFYFLKKISRCYPLLVKAQSLLLRINK